MTEYSPKHVQNELKTSSSTLRRWSRVFSEHLSQNATETPRRYTEADLATLRRAAALLRSGLSIDEVSERLHEPEPVPTTEAPPELPPEPTEAPTLALQTFSSMADTLHATQSILERLEARQDATDAIADLARRIDAIERKLDELARRFDAHDHGMPGPFRTSKPRN